MQINCGQYLFDLITADDSVLSSTRLVYGDAPISETPADFAITLENSSFMRRWLKPQINFRCDQHSPFKPLPSSQAYAVMEWGMNWCIAAHEYSRFLLHAAVLVKDGKAIVLPALPGSGKSTLSAFLGLNGWSVYSDEMAVIDIDSQQVLPLFRPVCLKNNSITLLKEWHPNAIVTPICRDTQKGDVAHVKVLNWIQYQQLTPAPICSIIFPKYQAGKDLAIYQLDQLDAFNQVSRNAFNYSVLGQTAFEIATSLVSSAGLYQVEYSELTELAVFFDELVSA